MNRQPGVPGWIDLSTSDLEGAQAFYGDIFGWEFIDQGEEFGNYVMISKNGKMVGGMMTRQDESVPVAWTVYLTTDDINATSHAVTAAGGQMVYEPVVVGDAGSMSVAKDPAGAFVGFWQPDQFGGFELDAAAGAPCWFQIASTNFESSLEFYTGLFPNLTVGGMEMEGMRYNTLQSNGQDVAGLMDATWLPEGSPSYWELVLGVENTDVAVATARKLGATILNEGLDTEWGRMAALQDPQGALFAIIQVG